MAYRVALGGALIAIAAVTATNYSAWFVIPKMRGPILSQLKDPGSAQFSDEFVSSKKALCGRVNAKNGFGAYTGFKPFIITQEGELILPPVVDTPIDANPATQKLKEEIARLEGLLAFDDALKKHCV